MYEDIFNLRLDGFVLNEPEKIMYGSRNGVTVLIEMFHLSLSKEMTHRISASLDLQTKLKKDEFLNKIRQLEEQYNYVSYAGSISDNVVSIVIADEGAQTKSRLEYVVHELTTLCNEYDINNKCELCDAKDTLGYVDLSEDKKLICKNCCTRLLQSVNKMQKHGNDNMFLGLIGAVLGALIGSVLWIILDQVGFIAGIAGYAIVFCSIKGYDMLGRTISKRGIVICVLVCIFMILFADCFSLGITIYNEFKTVYAITFADALLSVPYFLTEAEVLKSIIINLVIGYIFAIWASFSFIKSLWSAVGNHKKLFTVKKL